MKNIILITVIFYFATSAYAKTSINDYYTCNVTERNAAFFWPTKKEKDIKGFAEFQHDTKNEYIKNITIIVNDDNVILKVKNNDSKNINETRFTKLKDSFNNKESIYVGNDNDSQRSEWLFKLSDSSKWRLLGHDITINKHHQDINVGLMMFDCKKMH